MYIELNFEERKEGDWSIETFYEKEVKYQRLLNKGIPKMLNTPDIVEDFVEFLTIAEGSVLINGLGMGMCNVALLKKETLRDITVIEYDKALVDFIAPLFDGETRCTIIHADAYTWEPPKDKFYDYVWHDVWTVQSPLNIPQIEQLYSKYKDKAGWQGAWREEKCRLQAAKEAAENAARQKAL